MTGSYYQAGTVAVANGSDTVTGTGTEFVAYIIPGESFRLVDGGVLYEIISVTSNTEFKIDPAYMGSTQLGQDYRILPVRGYGAQVIQAMTTAIGLWAGFRDGALAGLFGDGAAGDSGLGFKSAPATGWLRKANGDMAGQRNGTELLALESGQVRIKKLVGDAVQSSLTDDTAGRLGLVGGFGLGGESIFAGFDIDAVDNSIAPGWYHFNAGTVTGTPPTPTGDYHMLHRRRASGGGEYQWALGEFGSGESYIRKRVTGSWTVWALEYNQSTILGTVSQSGGVPTGALFQYGSGPNGEYLRFADGTQICWHNMSAGSIVATGVGTFASPYRTAPFTWNFPAQFSVLPEVFTEGVPPSAAPNWNRRNSVCSSGVLNAAAVFNIELHRTGGDTTADVFDVSLMAIGRWF